LLLISGDIPRMRYCAVRWQAASISASNEYHEGVEACYRLAGEAKTETDRLAWRPALIAVTDTSLYFITRTMTVIELRFSIPGAIESHRPART